MKQDKGLNLVLSDRYQYFVDVIRISVLSLSQWFQFNFRLLLDL